MLWADAIIKFRKSNPENSNWKLGVYLSITSINALNLWIVFLWLKYFDIYIIPSLNIDIFPGTNLNNLVDFVIRFASPFILLNYFLIFYNNRYEKIISKYNQEEKKYAGNYCMIVLFLSAVSMALYVALTQG
jgi:1-acyl-sn-glycerol-3-phosphate acyltransferase